MQQSRYDRQTVVPALAIWASSLTSMRTCDLCERQAEEAETLTWTTSVENGRRRTYCDDCSRTHLRAIEGKLNNEWW